MAEKFTGYTCSLCGSAYGPGEVQYVCPKDGGNLNVVLDYAAIQKSCSPRAFGPESEPSLSLR